MTARGMLADDRGNNCEILLVDLLLAVLATVPLVLASSRVVGDLDGPAWLAAMVGSVVGLLAFPVAFLASDTLGKAVATWDLDRKYGASDAPKTTGDDQ